MQLSNLITTVCGQTFKIDKFEQLAVGIFQSDASLDDQMQVPDTYALYYTVSSTYLLEKATFKQEDMSLETSYQIITENQATKYLNNCLPDIS